MNHPPITVKRLPLTGEIQIVQVDQLTEVDIEGTLINADIILVHPSQAEKLMEDLIDAISEEFDQHIDLGGEQ